MKSLLPWVAFAACLAGLGLLAAKIHQPGDAPTLVGQTATVEGTVASVIVSQKGDTFINFGDTYPRNVFVAIVFASDRENFKDDLRALSGQRIRVTGYVRDYHGKPQVTIQTAAQLEVLP